MNSNGNTEWKKELEELAPKLAGLPKRNPSQVPERYFEISRDEILAHIQFPVEGDKPPYHVPGNYFETLPDQILARAKAEERRAAAVALEQEMIAEVARQRGRVVEAEAEVPRAMAEAFRSGNLGIMDYYQMKNIQADTEMRDSISKPEKKKDKDNNNGY